MKHNSMLTRLALVLSVVGMVAGVLPVANAGEAAKYIGRKIDVSSDEYKKLSGDGFAFTEKKVYSRDSEIPVAQPEYLQGLLVKDRFANNKVFLLLEEHMLWTEGSNGFNEKVGNVDWVLVRDAIDIPKEYQFIGKPIENECVAEKAPLETIFVIGKWVSRGSPRGRYVGGYAYPISKAWRVDFETKRLIKISTTGIKCEDNRTEADF